jgi:NDP-4-keto-2,6-dideoxyhexose 3-C-methyltransferase
VYKSVKNCRICGNENLVRILDLGTQMLTGVFPKTKDAKVTSGPLQLVKCMGENACGLVQLEHSYNLSEMYGLNYGYRSGLNKSMVEHLHSKIVKILTMVKLNAGDLVIDIGSNDSTTLQAYAENGPILVGIDPTGVKFHSHYPPHVQLIPDFFSSDLIRKYFPDKKAKVITSFSMFYDLEDPVEFMQDIHEILDDHGVWIFEQSYMPMMLSTNSFDTVCHEHLEFYTLKQIQYMADKVGFHIVDVELNDVNGGSFSITVRKAREGDILAPSVQDLLDQERDLGFDTLEPFVAFEGRIQAAKKELLEFLSSAKAQGKKVAALGASTKGNVLLQYCGLTGNDINAVGEVNSEKFDCFTPGTWIPIIPEEKLLASKPDYLIVLPWHFRNFFIGNPKFAGIKLVFPLPQLEVVG